MFNLLCLNPTDSYTWKSHDRRLLFDSFLRSIAVYEAVNQMLNSHL